MTICDTCNVEFTTDSRCRGCDKYRSVDHSKVIDEFTGVLKSFYPDDEFLDKLIDVIESKLGGDIVEYPKEKKE